MHGVTIARQYYWVVPDCLAELVGKNKKALMFN